MKARTASGPVAWLGVITRDGRHLAGIRFDRVIGTPIVRAGKVVGVVHDVAVDAAGVVHVTGLVDLPPGRYPCGIDLDAVVAHPWGDGVGGETLDIAGRFAAVTVYEPDDPAPAFPDAHLTVGDEVSS